VFAFGGRVQESNFDKLSTVGIATCGSISSSGAAIKVHYHPDRTVKQNALSVLTRLSAHRSDLFGLSVHARREAVCPPESMQTCRFPWCRASFKLPLYRMVGHCISMVDLFSTLERTATTATNRQERGSFTAVAPMLRASDKLHG
jgi:hypothetical protein